MANNKNHHYVPKFYLKKFSNNANETHIGLFNITTGKFIRDADLKGQSKGNYSVPDFYDKTKLLNE